jgi:hypothetical protein
MKLVLADIRVIVMGITNSMLLILVVMIEHGVTLVIIA